MSDGFNDAAGMIGTGIGLGIMTMGAMVPLVIMKKIADEGGISVNKKGKNIRVNVPKMNVNFKMPKINVKKIKIK